MSARKTARPAEIQNWENSHAGLSRTSQTPKATTRNAEGVSTRLPIHSTSLMNWTVRSGPARFARSQTNWSIASPPTQTATNVRCAKSRTS